MEPYLLNVWFYDFKWLYEVMHDVMHTDCIHACARVDGYRPWEWSTVLMHVSQ